MQITNITEAKASLSKLIERVLKGEEVIIGKARVENLTLVTHDPRLKEYEVRIIDT